MKNLIATYLFLLLTCACNEKRSAIGWVTKVVPYFELKTLAFALIFEAPKQ